MAHVPTGIISHSRKVCNFYKKVLRHLESCIADIPEYRYHATLMRHEFDKKKDLKDLRIAKELLKNGEKELFDNQHYSYMKFAESPGGCAYEREHTPPDWVLDYWHPMEKAAYPKYFALREQRKKEYEEFYRKEYGSPQTNSH